MESRFGQFITACLFSLSLVKGVSAATYVVDTEHSFVSASYTVWTGTPVLNLGTLEPSGSLEWTSELVEQRFALSGTVDVIRTPAVYLENAARISINQDGLIVDAPGSVEFALSDAFLQFGTTIQFDSNPCFGSGFDLPPNITSYCSGWTLAGYGSASEGVLDAGVLTLSGYRNNGFSVAFFPDGSEQTVVVGDFNGAYTFELRAVALVPEPTSMAMLLVGIGVMGAMIRRERLGSRASRHG